MNSALAQIHILFPFFIDFVGLQIRRIGSSNGSLERCAFPFIKVQGCSMNNSDEKLSARFLIIAVKHLLLRGSMIAKIL